jgi:hypothetical protein
LGLGLGYGLGYYGYDMSHYYPYPYPYPPVVAVPSSPPAYVQQEAVLPVPQPQTAPQLQANYWHYCRSPDGYYPYVRECAGGWERVSPQPPNNKDGL